MAMQFNAVVETNTNAIRLWESLGFRILATVPEAFRHPDRGSLASTSCTGLFERTKAVRR